MVVGLSIGCWSSLSLVGGDVALVVGVVAVVCVVVALVCVVRIAVVVLLLLPLRRFNALLLILLFMVVHFLSSVGAPSCCRRVFFIHTSVF